MFMPLPVTSAVSLHVQIARSVSDLGHETWLVLPANVLRKNVVDLSGLSVIEYNTKLNIEDDVVRAHSLKAFLGRRAPEHSEVVRKAMDINTEILSNSTLYRTLKTVQADLFVFDDDCESKMFVIFPYRMSVPFACMDFGFEPFHRRVPFSPASTSHPLAAFGRRMSFLQKLQNTFLFLSDWLGNPFYYNDAVARFAPEMPYIPLDQLIARAEIWLVRTDPVLGLPVPTLPNVKLIGGIGATPAKPLTPKYQVFVDAAEDGVVVATFGSMVLDLPDDITHKLFSAFLRLPMRVVFKSNVSSPDPTRILTAPWIPQNDLLAHHNVKVFLTHCGLNGLYQALDHTVPVVGLPLFYDQFHNAKVIEEKAADPMYKNSISRASALFREQFGEPIKTSAYWLDHVMQYGGQYMRTAGQEMALYEFLLLDVLAVLGLTDAPFSFGQQDMERVF
nr:hypothetical protein BaRGS_015960 [Batillaria attramentaria]